MNKDFHTLRVQTDMTKKTREDEGDPLDCQCGLQAELDEAVLMCRQLRDQLTALQMQAAVWRRRAEDAAELRLAAAPFAALLQPDVYHMRADQPDSQGIFGVNDTLITLGDLRRLRDAMNGQ